jgi:hypothetical protein
MGGAAAGALAAGSASAASTAGSTASAGGSLARSGSGAFSRLNNASPSQRTLAADGGLQSMNAAQTGADGASAGGSAGSGGSKAIGGVGPSGSSGASATGDSGATDGASDAHSTGTTESGGWRSETTLNQEEDITHATDQAFDTTQRYEPYTYHENAGFQRIDPPKNAEWLTEKGGFDRLDEATDEPLRFKGENDGQMYDLSDLGQSGPSYSPVGNSGAETIRDT